jgi:uncharacterized membrane protein YdjX (TVP38/TMEM64 family)
MTFGPFETFLILLLAIGAVCAFLYSRSLDRRARDDRFRSRR